MNKANQDRTYKDTDILDDKELAGLLKMTLKKTQALLRNPKESGLIGRKFGREWRVSYGSVKNCLLGK